jgi:hypothetical protein
MTNSSVDPTVELAAIKTHLETLTADVYEGVDEGTVLALDAFGNPLPYRDMQPGSTIPSASGNTVGGGEQDQPHVWAFQVEHVAMTRKAATDLAIESDRLLLGWAPSANASAIKSFFFTVYDATEKNGERTEWIATRFYETTLGMQPAVAN